MHPKLRASNVGLYYTHSVSFFSTLKDIFSFKIDLLVKSEPMEIDLVDSDSPVETLKKPVKQVPIKKEVLEEMTLSNMLSATSTVWMQ